MPCIQQADIHLGNWLLIPPLQMADISQGIILYYYYYDSAVPALSTLKTLKNTENLSWFVLLENVFYSVQTSWIDNHPSSNTCTLNKLSQCSSTLNDDSVVLAVSTFVGFEMK